MGGKKNRFDVRKNREWRKQIVPVKLTSQLESEMGVEKHHCDVHKKPRESRNLIVSIQLTNKISVLPVSVPHELYMACPVETLHALRGHLRSQSLPPQWYFSDASSTLLLFKTCEEAAGIADALHCSIECHENLSWNVDVFGKKLDPATSPLLASQFSTALRSVLDVMKVIAFIDSCKLCVGNGEQRFLDVIQHREAIQQGTIFCEQSLT